MSNASSNNTTCLKDNFETDTSYSQIAKTRSTNNDYYQYNQNNESINNLISQLTTFINNLKSIINPHLSLLTQIIS